MSKKQLGLTKRQLEVLSTLVTASKELSYPPSVRELATRMGLSSPSSIKHHLDQLEEKGYLKRAANSPRAIEILPAADNLFNSEKTSETVENALTIPIGISDESPLNQVPLVGRIAAGSPITADQMVDEVFSIPQRFTGRGELFMLEVKGESMIDAAICDGDWVIVRSQSQASKGEIVAAMIDGEATVKVFSPTKDHIWLLPCNENYQPILADNATILGKVVTVIRSL